MTYNILNHNYNIITTTHILKRLCTSHHYCSPKNINHLKLVLITELFVICLYYYLLLFFSRGNNYEEFENHNVVEVDEQDEVTKSEDRFETTDKPNSQLC